MSIKRRLFFSNIAMVLIPLSVVLLAGRPLYTFVLNAFYGETQMPMNLDDSRQPLFWLFAGTLIFAIIIITVVNVALSKRMITKIMVPVGKLMQGAERIKQGDLSEAIYYAGNDELAPVCESFNEMQQRLRENIERNIAHERRQREMIAGISHDLKTPLTAIKGYVKGLKDGIAQTEEKRQSYLDIIYQKTGEMEAQIEALFLYAKLETGNVPFHMQKTHLNAYLATYLDAQKADFENRGAQLLFRDAPHKVIINMDHHQMDKVLVNIMENSVKYATGEGLAITISLHTDYDTAVIRVSDNGPGVPTEHLPHIFDSFFRIDKARGGATDGSGLGLSIAKNVLERHGGTIYAENDNGLAVVLELPFERGKEACAKF